MIHTENRGAAAARNTGFDHASGRYITFLDGDDYLAENMIERLHHVIKDSAYDMVVCDFLNLLSNEKDNFIVHLLERTVSEKRCSGESEEQKELWHVDGCLELNSADCLRDLYKNQRQEGTEGKSV